MAKYSVYDVAEWFLQKEPMTHKKLQKMCYYAQAWSCALLDEPMTDARFEAWVHGPVSPDLYNKYKGSGWNDLHPECRTISFNKKTEELLESVYATYGEFSGNSLEMTTHSEPPWQNARAGYGPNDLCDNVIKHSDMKEYYQSIYTGGEE